MARKEISMRRATASALLVLLVTGVATAQPPKAALTVSPVDVIDRLAKSKLTGHLKTVWIGRRISVTDVGHDTEALPDRSDGRAVGASRAADPSAQVGHEEGRPTGHRSARGSQRDLLPPAGRVVVGTAAPRFPALQDGIPL